MTTTKLTHEQETALSAHDRTVSLAAGAGCGKTFVLTERFLSYLDPQELQPTAELQQLVAITFTDAAAREMRDRIRRRCFERLEESRKPEERAAWQQILRGIDTARISTIHSFCDRLLRSHAVEAGIDPQFDLLDPPAAELLRLQTLDDFLRELLEEGDSRILALATRFRLRTLREHLAILMGQDLQPFLATWNGATTDHLVDTWKEYHRDVFTPQMAGKILHAECVGQFRHLCQTGDVNAPNFPAHVEQVMQALDQLEAGDPHDAARQLHKLARVQGVCTKKQWEDEEEYEQYKNVCGTVRKLIEASLLTQQLDVEQCQEFAGVGLELAEIVGQLAQRHHEIKQAENVLEFDDLLRTASRLLTQPEFQSLRKNLVGSIRLLMVDEFQDTDPLQVEIVKALCGDDWKQQGLFVVGDHKQSIYRFRGAEPRVSGELRQSLDEQSRLALTTNFRSQPAILDFVNHVFCNAFAEEYESLNASRPQTTPTPAVEFLWATDDGQDDDRGIGQLSGVQRERAREAGFIARRLAELIDSAEPLIPDPTDSEGSTELRPLQLGDIAILLRSLSDVAIYEDALRQQGLDYYLAGGHAFYAQQEIYDLLNLLRAVDSEADELSLGGALRSPIFALTDETLFWLVKQHGSLNRGLSASRSTKSLNPAEVAKVQSAATTLEELRRSKDGMLVEELISLALERTGYDATLLCEFLGERKLANIRKLVEQARTVDRSRPGDLNGFITQLAEFVVRAPKEALATTQAEGDVIRIMTIHNAKGLEFPLVVLPDLERTSRPSDTKPVFDPQLGPLVTNKDKKRLVGFDLHRALEKEQDFAERQRLLYVACTRAADYLILSSNFKDLDKPKSDWSQLLASRYDLATGRPHSVASENEIKSFVRVTTSEPPQVRKKSSSTRGENLDKLVDEAEKLIAQGKGTVPPSVAPIPVHHAARSRFSFSRLSGALEHLDSLENVAVDPVKESAQPSALDPLSFGTLVHDVLERVDFSAPNNIASLCQFLAPQHFGDNAQQAAEEAEVLSKQFLKSSRADQLAQAQRVMREVEFLLPWPEAGNAYLQGFIDCLYQDAAGHWHVLDYKSNQGSSESVPKLAEKYHMQMYVYALACKRALGVAPVESVLYFLRPQTEFVCTFDENQERLLHDQITAAIANQRHPTPQPS